MPRLAIIIPALNEASAVAATLEALAAFRSRGVEVIVADGGSPDRTAEVARPLADKVIAAAGSRAARMNAGAAAASGDVLLFLHPGAKLPPDADGLALYGVVDTGRIWGRFDVTIEGRNPLLRIVAAAMNWRSQITGIAAGEQAIFVTRDAFVQVGGYPDVARMEGIALSRKLKPLGAPLCLAARATASSRRWSDGGVIRTIVSDWRRRLG